MRVRCPASSANLGPGFDALAIALTLYVEVSAEPADELSISCSGEGADMASDSGHLAAQVARAVCGHDHFAIDIRSEIPLGRGLGSSAALAAATAAALGGDPLRVAARFDGHPDNAAAAVLGGLVVATMVDGVPVAEPLPLDRSLGFVVVVPDRALSTDEARAVLPRTVSFDDAVANLGRMGLLLAGLADATRLHAAAGEDRLHQPVRRSLFRESDALMAALSEAGAALVCWSGAGPSMLGICRSKAVAEDVRAAGEAALSSCQLSGRVLVVGADTEGLVRRS